MTRIKKILLNPWIVGVGTPFIVTGITALVNKINFFEAIKLLLLWVLKIITLRIPLYAIILAIIFLVLMIATYTKIQDIREKNRPDWLNYTRDDYKDWVLKWEYYLVYKSNSYRMKDLRPICRCGCELSLKWDYRGVGYRSKNYYKGTLVCANCESTYPGLDEGDLEDARKKIEYNINTDDYPRVDS